MSYPPYTRLDKRPKTGPVRPLNEPRKPKVRQLQSVTSSRPSSSSDTSETQSIVRFVPNIELVGGSSAPLIPSSSSSSSLPSSQPPQTPLPQTPLPQTPQPQSLQAQSSNEITTASSEDQQSARGFSIRRPHSIVKTVPGEDISYQMYREEMRLNTLVACLGVVISAAALVVSVSKNKNVNDAIIIISMVVVSLISVILIIQLSSYDWTHVLPGGVVFISILVILGTYFASGYRPA